MSSLEPVGSDDILYRLRKEMVERRDALKLARATAYLQSIRDDEWVHDLTRDAAFEIERLRMRLRDAGLA